MALHLFLDAFVFVQVLQCLFLLLVVFQGVFEDQSETDDGEDGQVAEGDGENGFELGVGNRFLVFLGRKVCWNMAEDRGDNVEIFHKDGTEANQ